MSLFRAAAFANGSASSIPYIPRWALIHENSIVLITLSKVDEVAVVVNVL